MDGHTCFFPACHTTHHTAHTTTKHNTNDTQRHSARPNPQFLVFCSTTPTHRQTRRDMTREDETENERRWKGRRKTRREKMEKKMTRRQTREDERKEKMKDKTRQDNIKRKWWERLRSKEMKEKTCPKKKKSFQNTQIRQMVQNVSQEKSLPDELFLFLKQKFRILPFFQLLTWIRIRFFGPGELIQPRFRAVRCCHVLVLLEIYKTQNRLQVGFFCRFESHTFVPRSWMCKKQTSVSHSSTEFETFSLCTSANGWYSCLWSVRFGYSSVPFFFQQIHKIQRECKGKHVGWHVI